jgi:hypothetical protein
MPLIERADNMKNVIGNIRNIIRSIYKRIKSSYGKMNGLSSCSHCGLAWNVVNGEHIPYTARSPEFSHSSMFPICIECFDKLDSDQIFNYCQELVNRWKESDVDMDIVMYNIKCMKMPIVDEKDVRHSSMSEK